MADITIAPAGAQDLDAVRDLFREYAAWLQVDYCLQDFEAELAGLPGAYAPPAGGLWIARVDGAPAGVIGLWPLDGEVDEGGCEMKRLWVREAFRGHGLGHRLVEAAVAGAKAGGHRRMVLETLDFMAAAQRLYAELGFRQMPQGDAPANVRRLACDLSLAASA